MKLFVTGGSRGIGRQLVLSGLHKGFDVAFTYFNKKEDALSVQKEAHILFPQSKCQSYQLDVRHSMDVDKVVEQAVNEFDGIDVVVNNAGITRNQLAFSMSDEEWDEVIQTNLTGAFYITRQFLPNFLSNGFGRFIYISSIAKEGMSGQANYSASKAGLVGFSGAIAKEYGAKSITSNVVSPGFFDTDMTQNQMSTALKNYWMTHCPLKRMGTLEELADVILFLGSKEASFINGQVIGVTGGLDWAA